MIQCLRALSLIVRITIFFLLNHFHQNTQSPIHQKVKLFLYKPSVGMGDPLDWDWIVYLKK